MDVFSGCWEVGGGYVEKRQKVTPPENLFIFCHWACAWPSPPTPSFGMLTALLLGKDGPLLEVPPTCFQIPGGLCFSCLATGKED